TDRVGDLYMAMDVFLLPSLYEGLGIAAVEAQAAGLPAVLSDEVPAEAVFEEI
ncbi:MAG: glycosyltransferase, partial [Oscillospiraceae bacterium]|nr:glycosyltransferase [Oscillospiraceae bacterium]